MFFSNIKKKVKEKIILFFSQYIGRRGPIVVKVAVLTIQCWGKH